MSEFKGTPGPWHFDKSSGKVNACSLGCVVDTCGSDVTIAEMEIDDHNGFLISAAPEMLRILQEILRDNMIIHSQRIEAKSIIAKALGESK